MTQRFVLRSVAAATLLASGFAATTQAQAADAVVRIGHVAPISGPQAHFGRDNENGARMAIDDLNAQGLTIGGKKVHFELVRSEEHTSELQSH